MDHTKEQILAALAQHTPKHTVIETDEEFVRILSERPNRSTSISAASIVRTYRETYHNGVAFCWTSPWGYPSVGFRYGVEIWQCAAF